MVAATAPSETIAPTAGLFKLFGLWATVVVDSARLYACARCHCHVVICRRCDRGNIYCPDCAPVARRESRRRAGARYQATEEGRKNHNARHQLYLELREGKVTHHGPQGGSAESPCALETAEGRPSASAKETHDATSNQSPTPPPTQHCGTGSPDGDDGPRCDFCGQLCSAFLRTEKLRDATPPPPADRDRAVPLHHPRLVCPGDCHAPRPVPRGRPASAPARAPPALPRR